MLFSEIYGSYFNVVAAVLAEAVKGELTGRRLTELVREKAFAESALTIPAAYVLSKKDSMLHGFFPFTAVFTMYFNGGMVPTYLIVKNVGLLDSVWSLIIPGLISTYYVIILRTALTGVPKEMI